MTPIFPSSLKNTRLVTLYVAFVTTDNSFKMPTVHLLDYVAGNIRSLVNAINQVGYEVEWVKTPEDVKNADVCEYQRL
jgi:hypothetical protein